MFCYFEQHVKKKYLLKKNEILYIFHILLFLIMITIPLTKLL